MPVSHLIGQDFIQQWKEKKGRSTADEGNFCRLGYAQGAQRPRGVESAKPASQDQNPVLSHADTPEQMMGGGKVTPSNDVIQQAVPTDPRTSPDPKKCGLLARSTYLTHGPDSQP